MTLLEEEFEDVVRKHRLILQENLLGCTMHKEDEEAMGKAPHEVLLLARGSFEGLEEWVSVIVPSTLRIN